MHPDQERQNRFEQVAMPHTHALLRTAARLAGDRSGAEDLVQETLLRAWTSFDQFQAGTNCKAWLFTILMHLWSRRSQQAASRPEDLRFDEAYEHAVSATSEDRMIAVEVLTAVDRLVADQRCVLLLSVVEGFAMKEIANMLSIPVGTVMSRLGRARAALRQSLRPGSLKPCERAGDQA
jgi:RNA polymerase sigma-70 factor (ECF subfamily)